jgi:hypothetical protein
MIEVSAWGRRRGSYGNDAPPPPPKAFTQSDYHRLYHAVEALSHTQMSHMYDDFTADELRELFVPEVYRTALTTTYSIEHEHKANGEIFLSLLRCLPNRDSVFGDDPRALCYPKDVTLRVMFNRSTLPDGFITPSPIFGSHTAPITGLRGRPSTELHEKFISTMQTMVRVAGEWATVKWVLERLHNTLKTPQQVRYVWPAAYTLATQAQLQIAEDLANPSSRAGNNAACPAEVMPYLKASYEVVARSVLLGTDPTQASRYKSGQLRLVGNTYELPLAEKTIEISGT